MANTREEIEKAIRASEEAAKKRKRTQKSGRVSLTKKQIETDVGAQLLERLRTILTDAKVTRPEADDLSAWLAQAGEDLTAIPFLRSVLKESVTEADTEEWQLRYIYKGLLKVLPPKERSAVKDLAKKNEIAESKGRPVREAQIGFIRKFGYATPADTSEWDAERIIKDLKGKTTTVRLRMILRFWGLSEKENEGYEASAGWIDDFYDEDPNRRIAWRVWCMEHNDTGATDLPLIERVPMGIGSKYLGHVEGMSRSEIDDLNNGIVTVPSNSSSSVLRRLVYATIVLALTIWAVTKCTALS